MAGRSASLRYAATKYGVSKNYLKQYLVPSVLASPNDGDPFARAERSGKGMPIARVCPKGRVRGAYKLKVPVWRVNSVRQAPHDQHGLTSTIGACAKAYPT